MSANTPMAPAHIAPLPVPPTLDDPVHFDERGDAFVSAFGRFQGDANALAANVSHNAGVAYQASQEVGAAELRAKGSADVATAAANMRGYWSDLSGVLTPPASVFHNDQYWALLRPIASVAASEPGVSEDWTVASSVTDEILAVMHAVALAR